MTTGFFLYLAIAHNFFQPHPELRGFEFLDHLFEILKHLRTIRANLDEKIAFLMFDRLRY